MCSWKTLCCCHCSDSCCVEVFKARYLSDVESIGILVWDTGNLGACLVGDEEVQMWNFAVDLQSDRLIGAFDRH
jgi:hypothetical protein